MVDNHEKLSEHEMAQYRKQFEQSAADFVEPAENKPLVGHSLRTVTLLKLSNLTTS